METFLKVLNLIPHPGMAPKAVSAVICSISWRGAGEWCLDFIVPEPPEALRLPPPAAPARADDLWQHTCFELFLQPLGGEAYREFNFSPSGAWAAYRFDGYRAGMAELDVAAPRITSTDPAQFKLGMEAHLSAIGLDTESVRELLALTPDAQPGPVSQYALSACLEDNRLASASGWRANLAAVIEEADGTKSYWALKHPPGAPDFHHPDGFVLELPAA